MNDEYEAGGYQPYAVGWDDHNNVFWTGADDEVYWNRHEGEAWTGAKALPGRGEYGSAPYAVGYEEQLYAYAVGTGGTPLYNVFDGEGWAGWERYEAEPPAKYEYQPSAYVYDGKQHVVYTGADGHAYYASYDGQWSEWYDLGENYAYDPYQYEYGGNLYLTYTGTDGYVYVKPYAGDGDLAADGEGYPPTPTPEPDY